MATGGHDPRQQSAPDTSSDSDVSLLAEFPDRKAYGLQFKSISRSGKEQVVSDREFVVLADSAAERRKLETVSEKFVRTVAQVDHPNQLLVLTDKGTRKSCPDKWTEPVMKTLRKETKVVDYKIINTGLGAEELKRQVDIEFSQAGLKCTQSKDNQMLLLLSNNRKDIERAEEFVKKQKIALASSGEFVTSSKLRVSVFKADITTLVADGIVSAVDEHLSYSGGVSHAVSKAAGDSLVKEGREYIAKNGPAKATQVVVTTGGDLPCQKVLHAVGPRWNDYKDKARCQQDLADTVYNCLHKASQLGLKTLGIPAISSRTFQVPLDVCAASYQAAIDRFDQTQGKSSLQHVVFVDTDGAVIPTIRRCFIKRYAGDHQKTADKELRVVLVGKIGAGKSATGNSLLKNKDAFLSKRSLKSVTHESSLRSALMPECDLQVVDTPGLFESELSGGIADKDHIQEAERIQKEIVKSISLLVPGPHVILLFFNVDTRFTGTEIAVYREVQKVFPDLFDHTIVVYTHIDSEQELNELLISAPETLKGLIEKCKGRVVAIDNKADQPIRQQLTDSLLQQIYKLKDANKGGYYSNDVIWRCSQLMMLGENSGKSVNQIKKEITDGHDQEDVLERVREDLTTRSFLAKLPEKCAIL